jgi:hemolysin III
MSQERKYTAAEEFTNAFSHALGAMFAIYAIVMMAVASKNPTQAASTAIFGATMFILFQSSTCYHSMTNETAKKVFQRIDHSAIFMLIAGTYTPILLLVVPFPISVALLAMVWYLAITGVVFSCMTLKFKYLSTGLYLLMGWLSIFLFWMIWKATNHLAVWYLLAGGLFYSLGCFFYLSKKRFMHSIWHLFVLGGAIMHYLCIMELLKTSGS